ncbi:hypothetical protein [Microbispora bryophytorum]|uniref:Uncharacterized protein n=1 Tax=Microbispora bryophytorum subsp. camponoti TaxID=1677852 RepID=A0ABR8L0Z3_9ACTN|nr:hypothetical protein [Microbispora camponoti]MBD3143607.1 hypothetical protein [Microbispora camponoti]
MPAQFVPFDGFDPLGVLTPYEALAAAAMFARAPGRALATGLPERMGRARRPLIGDRAR